MKLFSTIIVASNLLITALSADTSGIEIDSEILAQRGKGVVTQSDFAARTDKIPVSARMATLQSGDRVQDLLATMLLHSQLVADARESGFAQEQVIMDRMRLAAEAELAAAWVRHYVEIQPPGDYELLASEYYELNKASMSSPPKIDVSHILISTENRSDTDAKTLAESLYEKLGDDPLIFNELVMEYSDDPSASSNKGMFKNVKKGDMVESFEESAFALQVGEISEPVETNYGYHIIRLDAKIEPQVKSFDDVKVKLINSEKKAHGDRIKRNYLNGLTSLDVSMTQEALEEMVRRLVGEEAISSEAVDENTE